MYSLPFQSYSYHHEPEPLSLWHISAPRRFEDKKEYSKDQLHVVLGVHKIQERESSQQQRRIKRAMVHEKYSTDLPDYDIMLLELDSAIEFNDMVQPICLDHTAFPPGTKCVVSGWGRINVAGGIRCFSSMETRGNGVTIVKAFNPLMSNRGVELSPRSLSSTYM